jgi:hypothetical protein
LGTNFFSVARRAIPLPSFIENPAKENYSPKKGKKSPRLQVDRRMWENTTRSSIGIPIARQAV